MVGFDDELTGCLASFPEITERPRLLVEPSVELAGALGHDAEGKAVVILFVPEGFSAATLRPIIYHELCHMLNLSDPDAEFYKRADPSSIAMWDMMKRDRMLKCSHGGV